MLFLIFNIFKDFFSPAPILLAVNFNISSVLGHLSNSLASFLFLVHSAALV